MRIGPPRHYENRNVNRSTALLLNPACQNEGEIMIERHTSTVIAARRINVPALSRGGYFPGVATAPVLLGVSAYLAFKLSTPSRS